MSINYEKQTLDNSNPIARYAHRARFLRSKEIALSYLREGTALVDYGCGQGRFLHEISKEIKKEGKICDLYGYDPYMSAQFSGFKFLSDPDGIKDGSASVITCLEVCEHLSEPEMRDFVDFVTKKLEKGGRLLVTVPIMMGPAVLLKEMNRIFLFRRRSNIGTRDLIMSLLFGVVPPRAEDIKNSHLGYDWRVTLQYLERELTLEKVNYSPIRLLGWYGNSQALMLFKKP